MFFRPLKPFGRFFYYILEMIVMREYWRTVIIDGVENPRYKVSNLGKVKCLDWNRTGKERICKLSDNGNGYLTVKIDGVTKYTHRLVATAFLPHPDPDKNCIDHANTNKADNVVILAADGQTVIDSNLRWVTYSENNRNPITRKHMSENAAMLGKFGAEHHNSISIIQLSKDGQFIRKWSAAREVERELGINHRHIGQCCRGKLKSAGGFKWVYASDYQKHISDIKPLF